MGKNGDAASVTSSTSQNPTFKVNPASSSNRPPILGNLYSGTLYNWLLIYELAVIYYLNVFLVLQGQISLECK